MSGVLILAAMAALLQASSLTGASAVITEPGGVWAAAAPEIAPMAKPSDGAARAPLIPASYEVRANPDQAYSVERSAPALAGSEVVLPFDISTVRRPTGDRRIDSVRLEGSVTVPQGTPGGVYAGQVVMIINYN